MSLILIGFLSAPLFSNKLLQWISTRCRTVLHKSSDQCRKQYVTCLFAWRTICMTSQCILMTFDCRLHSTDLISVLFTSFYKLYTNMPTFRDLASCQSFRCKIPPTPKGLWLSKSCRTCDPSDQVPGPVLTLICLLEVFSQGAGFCCKALHGHDVDPNHFRQAGCPFFRTHWGHPITPAFQRCFEPGREFVCFSCFQKIRFCSCCANISDLVKH